MPSELDPTGSCEHGSELSSYSRWRTVAIAAAVWPWAFSLLAGLVFRLASLEPGPATGIAVISVAYLSSAIGGGYAASRLLRNGLVWGVVGLPLAGVPFFVLAALGVNKTIAATITPLGEAAKAGDVETCRAFLEAGADPSWRVGKRSAIELARQRGHRDVVGLLEAADAVHRAFQKRDDGAVAKSLQTARELGLSSGALASVLLHKAAHDGYAESVRMLVRHGADPDARTPEGRTALMEAVAAGQSMAALELIEVGADVTLGDERSGESPLLIAAQRGCAAVVAPLVAAGAAIEQTDSAGLTPLRRAVGAGDSATLEELLAQGADPDSVDPDGRSALEMAVIKGYASIERALLEGGALRNDAYERLASTRQREKDQRRAAHERLAVERQRELERRREQEIEARELRERKRQRTLELGGHQKCGRCAAGRPWSIQRTLEKAAQRGMDIVFMGDAGGSAARPSDYAGSCLQCRDFFCQDHADGDHCVICGSRLLS